LIIDNNITTVSKLAILFRILQTWISYFLIFIIEFVMRAL